MRIGLTPRLIATAGPLRIEKVAGGYQLWNDYRFIAFYLDFQEAKARMECANSVRPYSRSHRTFKET